MSIFKCKMCGGTIEFKPGATVGVCDSCGTKQTLPRLDDDRRANLYDRANHFRRNNEFDKAAGIYEQILNEDTSDAEAYWSLVLCRYGIEYVEDPATHRRVPTVNRAQFTSIFDDDNYKSALRYADGSQRIIYEEEANTINEIQKGILEISQKEEPFDVFICYKETDQNGRRTPDSVLANDLYHQLTNEGFKVFFARITLEDKLGTAYEPYIFAALNSAKVMVVLGTRPEYFNAIWVKNEWSRYLMLVRQSEGKKVLIPAYRDMDPYDLPEEFSHLQAQDMSKLGFMQDLIRGIKKITEAEASKSEVKETIITGVSANVAPLLKRAFMFLEDGEWNRADDFCEQVLNQDPENAQAYLGKLMAELHVRRQEDLPNCEVPFDNSSNYQKAIRFGDAKFAEMLSGYIDHINERNDEEARLGIYNRAVEAMKAANSESLYKAAASTFKTIPGFKDADLLAEQCVHKAEEYKKDSIYLPARSQMLKNDVRNYNSAINSFLKIPGWRDSDEQIAICRRRIEEITKQKEAQEFEEERTRAADIARENGKKKRRTIVFIAISAAIIIFLISIVSLMRLDNKKDKPSGSTSIYTTAATKQTETVSHVHNYMSRKNEDGDVVWSCSGCGDSYVEALKLSTFDEWKNTIEQKWADLGGGTVEYQLVKWAEQEEKWKTIQGKFTAYYLDSNNSFSKVMNIRIDSQGRIHSVDVGTNANDDMTEAMFVIATFSALKNADGKSTDIETLYKKYWNTYVEDEDECFDFTINKFNFSHDAFKTHNGYTYYSWTFSVNE